MKLNYMHTYRGKKNLSFFCRSIRGLFILQFIYNFFEKDTKFFFGYTMIQQSINSCLWRVDSIDTGKNKTKTKQLCHYR